MASENEASCESDPNFAVICGFLEKFGVTCGLANIDFVDLQEMLENTQEVSQELVELHVKLMRRARKSVSSNDRWERALIKTCHTFSSQDAWEIERFGYKKARISSKLRVLKELLEMQFDYNQKFKNEINKMSASDLRTQPLGRDRMGRAYWYQCDENCQVRIYKEDPDEETWTLVAKDRDGLVSLISQLGNGDTTKSSSEPVSNEDSNSVEVEKPTLDTGQSKTSSLKPDSDNTEKETIKVQNECAENDKNIEENETEEANSSAKEEEEEKNEEELNEDPKGRQEKTEVNSEEVKITEDSKEKGKECILEEFKNKSIKENMEKVNSIEEKLPVENCEDALNLCSKDLSHKENDKEEKACLDLSVKTGPCLRIKPITELMAQPQHMEMQKKEFMGIKGKYIRGDTMDKGLLYPNPTHLGKAVQSASYDAICYKRSMEDDIYPAPTSLKHPRFDRPTLLGSKKYSPYINDEDDEDEEDDEDVEEEIEEPLMLVQGEGSGFPNESSNQQAEESPIVGDEIEEPVLYVYGQGSGNDCQTGNKYLEGTEENKTKESSDNSDTSTKNEIPLTKSPYKLGTIIDSKTNKIRPRNILRKSRWDVTENSNEIVNNTNVNCSNSTKGDDLGNKNLETSAEISNQQKESISESVSLPPNQTFFFGSRSSFSPNTSPIKTTSLNFGASTVSDVQNINPTSISSISEKFHKVESSTVHLDNKTDQNLVGSNPSHSKVPENVDIENVDNKKEEKPLVTESKGVSRESASFNEHEQKCDRSLVNVSDFNVSEINKDNCADRLDNVNVSDNDNAVDLVKLKKVTQSDVSTKEIESEKSKMLTNLESGTSQNDSSLEINYCIKIDSGTKADKYQTEAVITNDEIIVKNTENLTECSKKFHSVSDKNSIHNSTETDTDKKEPLKIEENVSLTVSEAESTTASEECTTNELTDLCEKLENCKESLVLPDSCVSEENTSKLRFNVDSSSVEIRANLSTKSNEKAAESRDDNNDADDVPSSTTDAQQNLLNLKDADVETTPTEENITKVDDGTHSNKQNRDSCDYASELVDTSIEKSIVKEVGCLNDSIPDEKYNSLEKHIEGIENKTNNTKNISTDSFNEQNVQNVESTEEISPQNIDEAKSDNKMEEINDLLNKGNTYVNKEVSTDNIKNDDKISTKVKLNNDDSNNVYADSSEKAVTGFEKNNISEQAKVSEQKIKDNVIEDSLLQTNAFGETVSSESDIDNTCRSSSQIVKEDKVTSSKESSLNDEKQSKVEIGNKQLIEELSSNEINSKMISRDLDTEEGSKDTTPVDIKSDESDKDREICTVIADTNTAVVEVECDSNVEKKENSMVREKENGHDILDKKKLENNSIKEAKSEKVKIVENQDESFAKPNTNNKETHTKLIENEDDTVGNQCGIDAIKAIKITNVQAKCEMPETLGKVILNENKQQIESSTTIDKRNVKNKVADPQPLRFLRGRRPNQMLSVKSYATRNKNLVLRKETKPQIQVNDKNNSNTQKDSSNNSDKQLSVAKIEVNVENNVRRSTRRKPGDVAEKSPIIPQPVPASVDVAKKIKGRSRRGVQTPQETKQFEEVEVRHSKRLRLSDNQVSSSLDVETIDLTSENDSKHSLKKNSGKNCNEVLLKGGITIKPIYKNEAVAERKNVQKNGPFLTCVNIQKLKENPVEQFDSPLSVESSGGGDTSDVVIIEDDPLAVPDPYEASELKSMTLNSFQLDVDYTAPPPPAIITRSLRKRGITEPEIVMPTGGKRRKTKGKRQVDLELRRSIEEQKKQEVSSSDEEKKEMSPKRKPQSHKIKKSETQSENIPTVQPVKKPRAAKKKTLLGLDIPDTIDELDTIVGNVRQSRRIAQLKIKEEAERRKLEEITMTEPKEVKRKGKKNIDKDYKAEKRKRTKAPVEEEIVIDVVPEVEEKKKKRKRRRKHKDPRKIFDESNPWRSSSDSSSSNDEVEEEEEEIVEYSEAESPLFKSDHEFSPESDIEDVGEPQPLKRARTARKEDDVEDDVDEHACQKCGKSDHPEWILLCDGCDNGWHCSCLRPALLVIPEGDWFCPPCQHSSLVKQLEEKLVEYDKKIAKREIEERRKERLAYVGISLANVLPVKEIDDKKKKKDKNQEEEEESESEESYSSTDSSSSSDSDEPIYQLRQRRQAHSYRFNDYDELINSAIQDEMEAVKGAGNQGRGKDISTIVNAEMEEQTDNHKEELEPLPPVVPVENKELPPAVVPPEPNDSDEEKIKPVKKFFGRKKQRKLNSLDVSSGDDPDSDEDFKGSSSEEEEDDEFEEDLGSDSSEAYGRRRRGMPVRRSTRARTSRYDKDFINDDSEEDEVPKKKKWRSTWEDSESEESDRSWGRSSRRKIKKPSGPKKKRSKKSKKHFDDSDDDRSKKKKRRIKYGGLDDDDEDEEIGGRRTRGKKINYADVLASDSDEEIKRKAPPRIESDDDYVANEDQEDPEEDEEYEKEDSVEKEKTPEKVVPEEEKLPVIEDAEPKESVTKAVEPSQSITDVLTEEPVVAAKVTPDPSQENFDIDNLNSSIDDLPDDMPDDNDEDDSELNPIEEINKNLEEMDEAEMEKLMEEEEYANKQLQLMAMQLEKEKKRREREAKKKEMASTLDPKLPKKRGRKNKPSEGGQGPTVVQIGTLQVGPDMQSNPELSEPPGVTIPIFSEIPPSSVDGSPKKRRGRGKGKKTLEKEQAAAAAAAVVSSTSVPSSVTPELSDEQSHIPITVDTVANINSSDMSLANAAAMHGAKLAIAAPPQPFSQTQPTPSVITRMLQTQPGQGNYSPIGMGHNYYADQPPQHAENSPTPPVSGSQMSACVPVSNSMPANHNPAQLSSMPQQYMHGTPPRGMSSTVYRQPPPNINPYHRTSPAPPIRVRNPAPSIQPVYHSHHPLDPSPSGGGPINVPTSSMNTPDRSSPVSIPPSSDSPLSNKSDPTPPPPPYSRSQMRYSNMNATPPMASSPIRQQQNLLPPQHIQQQPSPLRNNMPYHPASMAPNYYGGYMTGSMTPEESLPPSGYHYTDQFSETNSPQDIGKSYDEENSGEFGGLVSYFSSQREDDLDT